MPQATGPRAGNPPPSVLAAANMSESENLETSGPSVSAVEKKSPDLPKAGEALAGGAASSAPAIAESEKTPSGEVAQAEGSEQRPPSAGGKQAGKDRQKYQRGNRSNNQNFKNKYPKKKSAQRLFPKKKKKFASGRGRNEFYGTIDGPSLNVGELPHFEPLNDLTEMAKLCQEISGGGEPVSLNPLMAMPLAQLVEKARDLGIEWNSAPNRSQLVDKVIDRCGEQKIPVYMEGVLETTQDGYGLLVFESDNYKIKPQNAFVPVSLIRKYGLSRGHLAQAQVHPHRPGETCPFVVCLNSLMGHPLEEDSRVEPFEDLVPYYPLERMLLETSPDVSWDNLSMRVVDMLTPIGFGQRGLIVSPPRTGKTVILQCIANAIARNYPKAHLIVLLVDERPEEVTDFQRQVIGEVISSTFDQSAESHVHAAEMVIEKSRRMVEDGRDVVILLDSITRLARAYNTTMPSSGKILSGGVEASALQKPKRFFGSARNIEDGGSLTILATALIDTGSRMDEVIFEEFKGTGNMELHLDRALVDKRIYPAINLEQSGTRKEELLYHPDEMNKIYSLRRAMKGVPSSEAMELLIQRVKKTKSNAEFLMGLNR